LLSFGFCYVIISPPSLPFFYTYFITYSRSLLRVAPAPSRIQVAIGPLFLCGSCVRLDLLPPWVRVQEKNRCFSSTLFRAVYCWGPEPQLTTEEAVLHLDDKIPAPCLNRVVHGWFLSSGTSRGVRGASPRPHPQPTHRVGFRGGRMSSGLGICEVSAVTLPEYHYRLYLSSVLL
jgi:hypothetical protein